MGIHALIVYFCFMLIGLINNYKKSQNCLYNGFYENSSYVMVFIQSLLYDGFYENCLHKNFSCELLAWDGFFIRIVSMRWFLYTYCCF